MRDLPPRFQHPSYQRRANRRVSDGTPREHRGGAPFGIRRLFGDEPSKTITGNSIRELVHPHEDRFLTLRECARLQTFPDWFL
jgi:DNA (cytosine-5)-methyltransferase 1